MKQNKVHNYNENFKTNRVTAKDIDYLKAIIGFAIIFGITLQFNMLFHLINNICYLTQNILRLYLFSKAQVSDKSFKNNLDEDVLPIYTILIPLYKEAEKVPDLLAAIKRIDYPKDKLDVKLIIEEDDYLTYAEIKKHLLPSYFKIINIPYSLPRTKPKALNYAMDYVYGQYVVIYDAEDEPDPQQLRKALAAFEALPAEYVCAQAKLNFYNADYNLLTKLFNIEYNLWFGYLLKGLSIIDVPVTLGGTSNHFKKAELSALKYWDAYNVTEDADLGIRIYDNGCKIHIMDSYTKEEAPVGLSNWLYQRARWIKGFIQTLLVFIHNHDKNSLLTLKQILCFYTFIGISTYSFFCLPWLILMIIINKNQYVNFIYLINSFFALSYSYGVGWYIIYKEKRSFKNFSFYDWLGLVCWPFYFLLHTVACYLAIWQLIFNPFSWNKTKHGICNKHVSRETRSNINV